MDNKYFSTTKNSLLIADIGVLCLIILVLIFLMQYPIHHYNILIRLLSALIFVIIVYWKTFLVIIFSIALANLIQLLRSREVKVFSIKQEIIFLTFGLALSMTIGFIFAVGIRSGKPDIEPALFFSYFNAIFCLYIISRIGIGVLYYIRKNKKIN